MNWTKETQAELAKLKSSQDDYTTSDLQGIVMALAMKELKRTEPVHPSEVFVLSDEMLEWIYEPAGNPPGGNSFEKGWLQLDETQVDPVELAIGTDIELEHTSDIVIAKKIALDHLAEFPNYYKNLVQMEQKMLSSPDRNEPAKGRCARCGEYSSEGLCSRCEADEKERNPEFHTMSEKKQLCGCGHSLRHHKDGEGACKSCDCRTFDDGISQNPKVQEIRFNACECGFEPDEKDDTLTFKAEGLLTGHSTILMFANGGIEWETSSSENEVWRCPECGIWNKILWNNPYRGEQ